MAGRLKIVLWTVCVLFLAATLVAPEMTYAQSDTEEAKDRLDGKSSRSSGSNIATFIYLTGDILPQMFFFVPVERDEPLMYYHPIPYNSGSGWDTGVRQFGEGQYSMLESSLILDLPTTSRHMEVRRADLRLNLRYWAFRTGYNYMKESQAPFGIHQYNLDVERKFRFLPQSDAGFFLGYRNFQLMGDSYHGFNLGVDITVYPVNPFSLQYIYNHTFLENGEAGQHQVNLGIHSGRFRFLIGYHHLDIIGVGFDAITAGIGFNL